MNPESELSALPGKVRDVRYFVHVHPNKPTKPTSIHNGDSHVRLIEGKCRRMAIIGKCWWFDYSTVSKMPIDEKPAKGDCDYYTATARPGYLVVELRSSCPHGHERMHREPEKDLLEKGKNTVVSYLPLVYPAEAYRHGPFDEIRALDPWLFEQIQNEIVDRGLRGDIVDPQVIAS